MTDEFDSLFVDKNEVNRELLRQLVEGKISLTAEGDVLFTNTVSGRVGVILFLLGRKILALRNILKDEAEGPTIISTATGTPVGTVKNLVIQLEKEHVLAKTKTGQYYVPNSQLIRLKGSLTENEK